MVGDEFLRLLVVSRLLRITPMSSFGRAGFSLRPLGEAGALPFDLGLVDRGMIFGFLGLSGGFGWVIGGLSCEMIDL